MAGCGEGLVRVVVRARMTGSCTQAKGEGCQCAAACREWVVQGVMVNVMVRVVVRMRCGSG